MEPHQSTTESAPSNSAPSASAKPKRVRPYRPRRPRTFPTALRQRLEHLGHRPPTNDTTQANMSYLIDRLSMDLDHFRQAADHWHRKYEELNNPNIAESAPVPIAEPIEESSTSSGSSTLPFDESGLVSSYESPSMESKELIITSSLANNDIDLFLDLHSGHFSNSMEAASFGTHFVGRLHNTSNPSLSILNLSAPRIRSDISHLINDSIFPMVIRGIETQIAVKIELSDDKKQYALSRWLKPDFRLEKALEVWNHIYAPMDVHPSRLMLTASNSCRIGGLEYGEDDPDVDYFDRVLAKANDEEIVDMLHYCTLLVAGLNQAVFEDPTLSDARTHIGRACERLLREVIFCRNTTLNPHLAQSLLDGLIASLWHFNTHSMEVAALTIVELSWNVGALHSNTVHPALKLLIAFFGMILTPSIAKRVIWKDRVEEIRQNPANQRSFQIVFIGQFTQCYFGLFSRDQDAVLQSLQDMDEILKEMPSDPHSLETWDTIAFHAVSSMPDFTPHPQSPTYATQPSSTSYQHPQPTISDPIGLLFDDFNYSVDAWSQPKTDTPSAHMPHTSGYSSVPAESDTYTRFIDEYGEPYVLGDNLKKVMVFTIQLLRAEAAVVFGDEESCMHWVDEAEKTLVSIPIDYMTQRVSIAPLKNIIKETCNFPSGKSTVVDEFERRMIIHDRARLGGGGKEAFSFVFP